MAGCRWMGGGDRWGAEYGKGRRSVADRCDGWYLLWRTCAPLQSLRHLHSLRCVLSSGGTTDLFIANSKVRTRFLFIAIVVALVISPFRQKRSHLVRMRRFGRSLSCSCCFNRAAMWMCLQSRAAWQSATYWQLRRFLVGCRSSLPTLVSICMVHPRSIAVVMCCAAARAAIHATRCRMYLVW